MHRGIWPPTKNFAALERAEIRGSQSECDLVIGCAFAKGKAEFRSPRQCAN
eukprot:m.372319 g.372319  ORF g.372319 m.372319 type:complete len:51 (+) comp16688_c0_seq15:2236-2388(+)